jgi:hypothetical protein
MRYINFYVNPSHLQHTKFYAFCGPCIDDVRRCVAAGVKPGVCEELITNTSSLLIGKWPAVAINDTRGYAVLHDHNCSHHNADKLRAAVDTYAALVTSAAAAGALTQRPDAWTRKRMMFNALALVCW